MTVVAFNRKRPCRTCPFKTDEHALRGLGCRRAREIVESVRDAGQSFTCHDDLTKPPAARCQCVGMMLMLEQINQPNQIMQIGERLGFYDRHAISGEVFEDFDLWIKSQATYPSNRAIR